MLEMVCFNGSAGAGGTGHPVTVHPDWSVTTPHDAEAERVAEAFGSYTSCVTHIERSVAAFRSAFNSLTRSGRVRLKAGNTGSWQVVKGYSIRGCCRGTLFGSAASAARHLRSPTHLSRQHRVDRGHLSVFLEAAGVRWGGWEATPQIDGRTERLVREPGGVAELWQSGIHVADIPALAAVAAIVDEPLPVRFYLGLTYGNADRRWVTQVLAHRPDPDVAAWLVWLDEPHKTATPQYWGAWLSFGLSRADVIVAVQHGISVDDVHAVASANNWPANAVAAQFVKWANAGCSLRVEHIHALKRHRVYSPMPSRRRIDALCEQVREGQGTCPDRTELAVLLEILGNRSEVLRALRQGVRAVDDLATYVTSDDEKDQY
ncbi:hypothetical protein ACQ86B_29030 (plasmid) [Mycolicibacterium aichiense]|uniref:hypothetical protein n=1 Tax=Mycolicibacterium aichiense TaxID=1799 RepID=UPI003D67F76F